MTPLPSRAPTSIRNSSKRSGRPSKSWATWSESRPLRAPLRGRGALAIRAAEGAHHSDRMTDLEALMWRLEQLGPMYRSQMILALALDRPVAGDVLVERVRRLTLQVPKL